MKNYQHRLYSVGDIFLSLFYRVIMIFGIIYLYINYKENPVLISLLICILIFIFVIIGSETYYLNEESLIIRDDSIYNLVFRKKEIYTFKEISKVEIQQQSNSLSESLLFSMGKSLLNQRHRQNFKKIFITYKNKSKKIIECHLSKSDITILLEIINSRLSPKT